MKARILQLRRQLDEFLASNEKEFEFDIDCPLEERIDFIYGVIFPSWKKPRFYWNFLIARIARAIDYSPIKVFLYRLIGVKIGKGVFISPDVLIDPHFPTCIELKDYSILGWGARLFVHESTTTKYSLGRITIGEGAMVGAFSTIRRGVTIGKMADIPYNTALVYRDVPDFQVLGVKHVLRGDRPLQGQESK